MMNVLLLIIILYNYINICTCDDEDNLLPFDISQYRKIDCSITNCGVGRCLFQGCQNEINCSGGGCIFMYTENSKCSGNYKLYKKVFLLIKII